MFGIFLHNSTHDFLKFVHSEKATKFAKSSPYFCLYVLQTKVRWRFRKFHEFYFILSTSFIKCFLYNYNQSNQKSILNYVDESSGNFLMKSNWSAISQMVWLRCVGSPHLLMDHSMKMHSFQIGRMQKDSFSQTKVLFALLRLELSFDIL